jgi:predicted site-specific integrase-resolvase
MKWLTGQEAAALLGISRKSLYRCMAEGRIACTDWTLERLEARKHELVRRKRGPARNPDSKCYHEGRHSFTK